jgi:predicted DsbA family dithiol-disulfide isomerase
MVVDTLAAKGLEAGIEYITDLATLQDYGIRTLPALLINGRVVVAGRVPAPVELEKILAEACRGE